MCFVGIADSLVEAAARIILDDRATLVHNMARKNGVAGRSNFEIQPKVTRYLFTFVTQSVY